MAQEKKRQQKRGQMAQRQQELQRLQVQKDSTARLRSQQQLARSQQQQLKAARQQQQQQQQQRVQKKHKVSIDLAGGSTSDDDSGGGFGSAAASPAVSPLGSARKLGASAALFTALKAYAPSFPSAIPLVSFTVIGPVFPLYACHVPRRVLILPYNNRQKVRWSS
eukprot:COSAG05_NODE_1147_length_5730_cov_3.054520_5_plen_165_part_00